VPPCPRLRAPVLQSRVSLLDTGSAVGLLANLCSRPVAATGLARRLVFITHWHYGSTSEGVKKARDSTLMNAASPDALVPF